MKCCENCTFWVPLEDSVIHENEGECRRYPKVVKDSGLCVFPIMSRSDWCGEWANYDSVEDTEDVEDAGIEIEFDMDKDLDKVLKGWTF